MLLSWVSLCNCVIAKFYISYQGFDKSSIFWWSVWCPKEWKNDAGNDESHKPGFHPNVKWTSCDWLVYQKVAVKATQITQCRCRKCIPLAPAMLIVPASKLKEGVDYFEYYYIIWILFLNTLFVLGLQPVQLNLEVTLRFFFFSLFSIWQFTWDKFGLKKPTLTFQVGVFACALQSGAVWQVFLTLRDGLL